MKKGSIGTVDKVLNVLDVFSRREKSLSISEIAELSGLQVSTAYRIASTLVKRGYLRQKEKRGKYAIGLRFLDFNNTLEKNLEIREVSLPFLEKLCKTSGESANLAILDANEVIYIEHLGSNYTLRTFTAVGNRAPLYCTGVGKVFLAYMNEEMDCLKQKRLLKFTDSTITDFEELNKELVNIRREGISVDNGEMEAGVRCIAAPITNSSGKVVAAVSVSGPYLRMNNERVGELKLMVKETALEISRSVGYRNTSV